MSNQASLADFMDRLAEGLPLGADAKADAQQEPVQAAAKEAEQPQHDPEQLEIALQGTYEAESILQHMLRNVSDEPSHAWIKAFILRLSTINSVCMSAMSGREFDTTEHLRELLEGRKNA